MNQGKVITDSKVDLDQLAELTGFPVELVKKELLLGPEKEVSIEALRELALSLIDRTFSK